MISWLRSFNFLTKFYLKTLKTSLIVLGYIIHVVCIIMSALINLCLFFLGLNPLLKSYINQLFTFIFISSPWWLYNVIILRFLTFIFGILLFFLNKNSFIKNTTNYLFLWVISYISFFFKHTTLLFYFLIRVSIAFFYLKRKNKQFCSLFYLFLNLFLVFLTILFLINTGIIIVVHNFLFGSLIDVFGVWGFSKTKLNYLFLFLLLLNIDNLILLLYLVFIKLGILNIFVSKRENVDWLCWIWFNWNDYFNRYKTNEPNFSFCKLILKNLSENESGFFKCIVEFIFYNFSSENIPVFFLFGFLFFMSVTFSWLFFSYLGLNGIYKLNLITLTLFWLSLLLYMDYIFIDQKVYVIGLGNWVFLNLNLRIDYYFLIDTVSFSFILLTTTIALFVFIYAFSYFRYEPLVDRFLLFILSFVISMIFLVSSGNTIMLFLGWELIGFTSFCLINFWTTKVATMKSAFKAYTFNKVSDFFLFLFLVLSFSVYYSFDIIQINKCAGVYNKYIFYVFGSQINSSEVLCFLLVGAAFIKSAQFGGHVWLPDSMEAPVPASALIHSATLVSAGIYLILRFNPVFDVTEFVRFIIPVVGSITAAYGGMCALTQSDIKKTLAYSTISHCGFLMVLCSTEMNEFTILYLYVHGFFKAGVFMCVGNVLRISRGYQDTRRMGSLFKYLPFDYFCISIGLLNLAGLPFTFGFMIKHLLLISLGNNIYLYYFVLFNSFIGAFSGLFYSYRIITYTFCDFKKGDLVLYNNLNRSNYNSILYSSSSLAATISIFCLFLSAHAITIHIFNCFLSGNYQFSDYLNTTILLNYYIFDNTFSGFLLNFSYVNIVAVIIMNYLFWSRFKKTTRYYNTLKYFFVFIILFILIFMFYSFL